MRNVERSALVPYSAEQMFRLVDDIEAYPEFLPWCTDATINAREGDEVVATLELSKGGLSKSFTTRNRRKEFASIGLGLVGGPFRHLEGEWVFADIEDKGSKVTLTVAFEFESQMIDLLLGRYFEDTCNSLVDAFTRRASSVYS